MDSTSSLLLVGCGKMGGALLTGWLAHGIDPHTITIITPTPQKAHAIHPELSVYSEIDSLEGQHFDQIIFAVKPQMMSSLLKDYAAFCHENTVILSVAAGISTERIVTELGKTQAVIRTMPNVPATIGRAVIGAYANAHVSPTQHQEATALLEVIGKLFWVEDEEHMHAITAISGSGSAYIFHFIEALSHAAIACGLPETIAADIAKHTVTGAAELAEHSPLSIEALRQQVTSPNGTTAAGLAVLMEELTGLLTRTTQAACNRSHTLGE